MTNSISGYADVSASSSTSTSTVSASAEKNSYTEHGLRNGFAYSTEHLLRLNSRSPEWAKISKSEKDKLGLTFEDDGEFW